MSAMLTGDTLLFDAKPRAIWDSQLKGYRYYYQYRSCIPLAELEQPSDDDDETTSKEGAQDPLRLPRNHMDLEVWVPNPSPARPFPEYSVVYLRGRMVMPEPGIDQEDASKFVLHIEVVFAHFRGCIHPHPWAHYAMWNSVLPEPSIIGKITEISIGSKGFVTFLIETVDELPDTIVRMNVV